MKTDPRGTMYFKEQEFADGTFGAWIKAGLCAEGGKQRVGVLL